MDLEAPLLYGITTLTLLTSGAVIMLLLIADFAVRRWLRRGVRASQPAGTAAGTAAVDTVVAPSERLANDAVRGLAAPLTLLLWTWGLSFAFTGPIIESQLGTLAPRLIEALLWLRGTLTLVAILWLLVRVGRLIETALTEYAGQSDRGWDDFILPIVGRGVRLILPLIAAVVATPTLVVSPELRTLIEHALSVALIGVIVFLMLRFVDAGSTLVLGRYTGTTRQSVEARAVRTRVTVLRKLAIAIIMIFGIGSMLMVFDVVRQLGTTLLASAGVAGIILGFAAQRSIATLLAGFSIALTQPIRVDDVVIVEGEWGRIEDITLTYVVVAIWDQRRLVLPITYFMEKPFQNWTRTGTELLGTVMLYTDYTVPLDELRAELGRVLKATPLWDERVGLMQVTDSKERTLELRVLVSAVDSTKAWDLRCHVREQLVRWLQQHHPDSLPRLRAELVAGDTASAG